MSLSPLQKAAQELLELHLPTYLDTHVSQLRTALEAEQAQAASCGYDETVGLCTSNPCCYQAAPVQKEQAVEPVCSQCKGLGYYDEGHENDDGSMSGGNYVDCACNKKDFTQCTTVTNDCLGGCKSLSEHQNYTRPAPPATTTGERAELIAQLRSFPDDYSSGYADGLVTRAADMLEADASRITELEALSVTNILLDVVPGDGSGLEIFAKSTSDVVDLLTKMDEKIEGFESSKQAQQVAVPSWKVGQALYNGADGTPPIFGRRWRLARDGFGLQRDDESGNYVQIDDAVSTMHAMLAAAQGAKP